jgi:uncharacterized protein YceH (UPF0502 family)
VTSCDWAGALGALNVCSVAMDELTPEEVRVLGCLIEKEATTPEQYPLTLNTLVLACNQATNREPVVNLGPEAVTEALNDLRAKHLTRVLLPAHGRVTKYRQVLDESWALTSQELAVLAVMMLRGPQTLNELKTRTERYGADLADLGGVEGILERLAGRPEPLVVHIPRRPGQREDRYAHLLAGLPDLDALEASQASPQPARSSRLDQLEEEVRQLRKDLDEMRAQLQDLLGP